MQNLHNAGSDKPVGPYSRDVVISVDYRIKSLRGTQFRVWATGVLREQLVKGYTVNTGRLSELNQALRIVADTAALTSPPLRCRGSAIPREGRTCGAPDGYNRGYCVDLAQLEEKP